MNNSELAKKSVKQGWSDCLLMHSSIWKKELVVPAIDSQFYT
jgi:hypothetical protein